MKHQGEIKKIKERYLWLRATEVALWSVATALLSFFILKAFVDSLLITLILSTVMGISMAVMATVKVGIWNLNTEKIVSYLNRTYPQLQESADLLIQSDGSLNTLQEIQKEKVQQELTKIFPSVRLPHRLGKAVGVLALSVVASLILAGSNWNDRLQKTSSQEVVSGDLPAHVLPAGISRGRLMISPPPYTSLKPTHTDAFDVQVPEGSTIAWQIDFSGSVLQPSIIFQENDSLQLEQMNDNNRYRAQKRFNSSTFYQVAWYSNDTLIRHSPFYKLQVVPDNPPEITIRNLAQFQEVKLAGNPSVNVMATVTDDYGIAGAEIIATVSKGSGEAVKFREERLQFDKVKKVSKKEIESSSVLNLVKLGLEPGDELYFYIQARDNKTPVANVFRTETYFITIQDTSAFAISNDMGLGVDVLPEYFRSQRQIIIDSEKLLKEKSIIPKESFNNQSNNLAHDQKLLRLRYGEFLGEEFESSIGPTAAAGTAEDDEHDIVEKFGHAHDKNNEHNLVEEKHDHEDLPVSTKNDPLSEMVHSHDSEEEATFFNQSIKTKLKAAITIMWDAELHLRLYDPQKSLPYQYKALKLLKEISQQSRIYVHRTGFDPPPLKEDKRLSGDLSEITNSSASRETSADDKYAAIAEAITITEKLIQDSGKLLMADRAGLSRAGRILAQIELQQPGRYLETLSLLQSIVENKNQTQSEQRNTLMKIRKTLWSALPLAVKNPHRETSTVHGLDRELIRRLEAVKPTEQ